MHRAGLFSGVLATTNTTKATVQQRSSATTSTVAESGAKLISTSKGTDELVNSNTASSNVTAVNGNSSKDRLPQQSLRALATLSNRKTTTTMGALSNLRAKPGINNRGNSGSNVIVNKQLNNPFLDQPPSKILKAAHGTVFSTLKKQPEDVSSRDSRKQDKREVSQTGVTRKLQPSLVLTRVLAANSPNKNLVKNNKIALPTATSSAISTTTTAANDFTTGISTPKEDNNYTIPTSQPDVVIQHTSTTPKQPPKIDYFRFLTQASSENSNIDENSNAESTDNLHLPRTSLSSSTMDFARRSIMQHATASPKAAVRKINKVTADSNGNPSLTDLLAASEAEENIDSNPYPSEESSRQSFAKPDTSFTFESTPLPSLDTNARRPSSSGFERNEPSSFQPTVGQRIGSSPDNGSKLENKVESEAEVRHAELDLQDSQATDPKAFDLKTALREDLARSQSSNTFLPRASIARRVIPYKPPTVNERETLRSSRMAGFRARPLDPKVFTSAGDLGVPRVKKQPLTIPVSPVFSKPRVKPTATSGPEPVKTAASARLANLIKGWPDRRPANRPQAGKMDTMVEGKKVIGISTSTKKDDVHLRSTQLSVPTVDQVRSTPGDSKSTIQKPMAIFNAGKTHTYPPNPVNRAVQERLFSGTGTRMVIQGPPIRGDGHTSTTTSKDSSNDQAGEPSTTVRPLGASLIRRPLTRPMPFKFATDEILRKRHVMFQPKKTPEVSSTTTVSRESKIGGSDRAGITKSVKYPQPVRKVLTVPVPFRLATQRRAEIYSQIHHQDNSQTQQPLTSMPPKPPSRLAGLLPLRSSDQAGDKSTLGTTSHFIPTIPISPKLGRRVHVPSLQPTRFLLKKSTKELTQPREFHFHSEIRAKEREAFEQSVRERELELADKERTAKLSREREERMKLRESLERTFRARSIKHYQPITIHKATKPLTKPVSPMIGEKRKRYEMEIQQEQERKRLEHSQQFNDRLENQGQHEGNPISLAHRTSNIAPNSYLTNLGVDQEVYRQFEEGKILQEEHQEIQKQLTQQELRQLELANSARATIHQPPIRLSFPLDPALQDLQDSDVNTHRGANHNDDNQQPNVIPPLPPVRDSFGGSNSHHLSRELRRISLEASRNSSGGGYRKRLSDIGTRLSIGSGGSGGNRGSTSGRTSLEGGAGSTGGYYPFTRSQEPTSSNTNTYETQTLSRGVESEDRRRSGSFIPLDSTEPSKTISPSRTSRLSTGQFGTTLYSSGKSLLNHSAHANTRTDADADAGVDTGAGVGVGIGIGVGSSNSSSRSRGPVVIEHTLTLSDL
ncbi:hypothetical protein BGZ79_002540 [Entomortierella chlamydospora]|nr:hypothetical protein BGZ79_002540 [Entomortierella chlamydospora]